jgi:uncharacterized protein (TIGR03067 family)
MSGPAIRIDDQGVRRVLADGGVEQVAWDDLLEVALLRGGEFTVNSGDYVWASGLVRVDAAARPGRVDFLRPLGPGRWSVQAGIYEVEGDELRLRLADGEVAPEGFDGEQGLAVYQSGRGEGRP